jgi:hypothetical protein
LPIRPATKSNRLAATVDTTGQWSQQTRARREILVRVSAGIRSLRGSGPKRLDAAVEQIDGIIWEVSPDTILTFPPDGQTGHPDHIAVHRWTAEAVRHTGIGSLHVVANTREWLDDHLAQWIELGAIVGAPPVAWTGPLSVDLTLTGRLLDRK